MLNTKSVQSSSGLRYTHFDEWKELVQIAGSILNASTRHRSVQRCEILSSVMDYICI